MTTEFLTLDVWNKEDIRIKVNQGEVNARFLQVQFIDKNEPLNLENKQVFFFAKKPDGHLIFNRCNIIDENDGTVNLELTSQMSIVDGVMKDCEFDIIATDLARLKVKGLILEIEKCTDFDSATESTSEFTALEEAIAGYERASDTIDAHVADKNNPHEVTATQVGAAETIHTHSTNDITNGTLPIARGGTNATSASNALTNLGGVPTTRTINSKALSSDITLTYSDIQNTPTNISSFTNDAGYLTTETDPTVPSWAKATTKPSYNYSEISNRPTKLSDFTNDAGFLTTETDPTVPSWAKATTTPTYAYSEISNRPTKLSDFTNDTGFLTAETDPTVPSWAKAATKPTYSYSEISNTPEIPTLLTDLTGTLPISMGGTGATTAADALTALGGFSTNNIKYGIITGNGQETKTTTISFRPRFIIVYLAYQVPIKYDSTNNYYLYNFAIGINSDGYNTCSKGMSLTQNSVTLTQTQGTPTDGIFLNLNKTYGQYYYFAITY